MAEPVTAQPQPIEGTLLVSPVQGHRNWTTGLFDCFSDCKTCVISYLCLPCMVCNIAVRLGDGACMPYVVPGSTITMRTRLRTLGGIQGSICNDCLVMSFCEPCAICQMSRELNNMGIK
ncbi:cornifelin homolog B-like isoform X2 [Mytilus edulis]